MKTYETRSIRNVTLLGSTDSGKTILTEAMMLEGKLIDRKGTIAGKNTVSDYTEIEQLNQKSIYATPLYTEFMDCKLNIIDTPGADDFVGAVLTALRVSATALMVVNAQHGVEVGTEILARWVEQMHKPMIIARNQLDHEKANYEHAMESLVQSFGNKVVAVQYPVKVGAGFDSFIDVLLMKMYKFTGDMGQREELPIPESEMERAKELLAWFDVPESRHPMALSRGQRTAAFLSLALAARAPLTLLDEPYNGLDVPARQRFTRVLREELRMFPRTLLLSTHLVDEAEPLFQYVALMEGGRVTAADTVRGMITSFTRVSGPIAEVDALPRLGRLDREGAWASAVVKKGSEGDLLGKPVSLRELADLLIGPRRDVQVDVEKEK